MQTTNNILLVRPAHFGFNTETETSNTFQQKLGESIDCIQQKVSAEFETFAHTLKMKGIQVIVVDDTSFPLKPDAIFPNNWISFHNDGTVILYPMYATNRRLERRYDIIETLKQRVTITNVIDLSSHEKEHRFVEGTGSIIFDHPNKIAYACLSPRTDKLLFIEVCNLLQYKPIYFLAYDTIGKEIYHTNVMMCIGTDFAIICLAAITNQKERALVTNQLIETGHKIIDISIVQMSNFAGNMLELKTTDDKNLLVLSQCAFNSLTSTQQLTLSNFCELVPLAIPTIETIGGGSARCMIAEIFSPPLTS
jgi:hypothetical protein